MTYRIRILVVALFILSGFVALAHSAMAAQLKSRVLVRAPVVNLSDLFDGLTIQDRALFRAPQPGTSGSLSVEQLRGVLAQANIDLAFDTEMTSIEVARAGQLITQELATELLKSALQQRGLINGGDDWQFTLAPLPNQLITDGTSAPFIDLSSVSLVPSTGRVAARLIVPGQGRITLSGTGTQMVDAVQLKQNFAAGEILGLDDLEIVKVPAQRVAHFEQPDIAAIVGKTLKSNRNGGALLAQKDIVPAKIIKRGNVVTIKLTNGALTLTARAQALEDGAPDDLIRVLNLRSNRTILATVHQDGTLSVPAPHATQKLAGL